MHKDIERIISDFKLAIETDEKLSSSSNSLKNNMLTKKLIEDAKWYDLDTIIEIVINFPSLRKQLVEQFEKEVKDKIYRAGQPTGWENADMSNPSNW